MRKVCGSEDGCGGRCRSNGLWMLGGDGWRSVGSAVVRRRRAEGRRAVCLQGSEEEVRMGV